MVNRVAVQLAKALQTKGMALLVNHGISEEKVRWSFHFCLPKTDPDLPSFQLKTAYSHLDDFCKLPAETKELYLRNTETGNHGYVKPGQERFDGKLKDIRHAYNICTLNLKLPEEVRMMWNGEMDLNHHFNQQPLPGFREHIAELAKDFKSLTGLLLQALAIAVDMPLNFFVEKHSHMMDGESENETTFR